MPMYFEVKALHQCYSYITPYLTSSKIVITITAKYDEREDANYTIKTGVPIPD